MADAGGDHEAELGCFESDLDWLDFAGIDAEAVAEAVAEAELGSFESDLDWLDFAGIDAVAEAALDAVTADAAEAALDAVAADAAEAALDAVAADAAEAAEAEDRPPDLMQVHGEVAAAIRHNGGLRTYLRTQIEAMDRILVMDVRERLPKATVAQIFYVLETIVDRGSLTPP